MRLYWDHVGFHPEESVVLAGMNPGIKEQTVKEIVRTSIVPAADVVLLVRRQIRVTNEDLAKAATRTAFDQLFRRLVPR